MYGYDGYHDLMDWCLRTIICLIQMNTYQSCCEASSRKWHHPAGLMVIWVGVGGAGGEHINSSDKVIGITHHGSVAEELVFNKIPVIASTNSYWGEKYKFGYCWKDVMDYENLISGKAITELVVTNTNLEELYRYAMDHYFSIKPDVNVR